MLKPSAYWEYPLVHLVNFLIYVAALGCFEFLLREFIRNRREAEAISLANADAVLPEWAWWTLGYSLFISSSIVLITIRVVTPDMCVAGFVYLVTGLILRIRRGRASRRTFALLGFVLGFAYLTKAVMFPLAFVFLLVAMFSCPEVSHRFKRTALSALIFVVVAAPFVIAISRAKGRLTTGMSGGITYAAYIDGVDPWYPDDGGTFVGWGGGYVEGDVDSWSPNRSLLRHPTRKIFTAPAAYDFSKPITGTYPFWYDPSYWQDGLTPRVETRGQRRALENAVLTYAALFFSVFTQLGIASGLLFLFLIAPKPSFCFRSACRNWWLVFPAASAFALYSLVHTEYRYVAVFASLLWLAAFSGVSLPRSSQSKKIIASVSIIITAMTGLAVELSLRREEKAVQIHPAYWKAATALHSNRVLEGEKIAMISDDPSGKGGPFVARLAHVQIVAQINRPDRFWASDVSTQDRVLKALRKAGVAAVLAWGSPPSGGGTNWLQLEDTSYYVHIFNEE